MIISRCCVGLLSIWEVWGFYVRDVKNKPGFLSTQTLPNHRQHISAGRIWTDNISNLVIYCPHVTLKYFVVVPYAFEKCPYFCEDILAARVRHGNLCQHTTIALVSVIMPVKGVTSLIRFKFRANFIFLTYEYFVGRTHILRLLVKLCI